MPLDVADFAQALVERCHKRRSRVGRGAAKPADHRYRLLLRAQGARRNHRAGQNEQHLAAPDHSITSSARRGSRTSSETWCDIILRGRSGAAIKGSNP